MCLDGKTGLEVKAKTVARVDGGYYTRDEVQFKLGQQVQKPDFKATFSSVSDSN